MYYYRNLAAQGTEIIISWIDSFYDNIEELYLSMEKELELQRKSIADFSLFFWSEKFCV
jgi:hypothetical protein